MISPISTIVLFVLIGFSVLLNCRCESKTGKIRYEASMKNTFNSRIYWFFFYLIFDYKIGKDIRIYRMQELIEESSRNARHDIENVTKSSLKKTVRSNSLASIARNLFLLIAYAFVGVRAVLGIISVGEMTKYVGMILLIQGQFNAFFTMIAKLQNQNTYLKNLTNFLDLENKKNIGTLPVNEVAKDQYEIEFRLKVGHKLAIVGQNGAGKTTFIKLLCRLYDPTEGEILLNHVNIKHSGDYGEYMKLFSVVFQDYYIFSFTVAENVAASTIYDEARVIESLKAAGIYERVKEFPQGIHTKLLKEQQDSEDDTLEISGGEKQKLALARALYKNAPIVILDEPTSALDPIAEQDIYERFNNMVQDKTTVFISHRMSSCKFCKDIIVFEDGRIVQHGNHDELVKETNGLYYEMWNAQAQYYKKSDIAVGDVAACEEG